MPRNSRDTGPFTAASGQACRIQAAEGESKLGTFTGNAYTGAVMKPIGWWGPLVIDLDGIKVPSEQRPVLRQHDHEQIVGHTTEVTVDDEGIKIAGSFSGQPEHTAKVVVPAKNGFQWQLSIGADPIRTEFLEAGEETEVNGRTVVGPLSISRETELGEISFVPLGADGNTSATVSASKRRTAMFAKDALKLARSKGLKAAGKYSDEDIDKMSDDDAKAALKKCMAEEEKSKGDEDDADAEGTDVDAEGSSDVDAADSSDVDAEDDDDKPKSSRRKGARSSRRTKLKKNGGISAAIQGELKAARSAAAAELRRQNEIAARCQKYGGNVKVKLSGGKEVDLVPHAIENNWSPDRAELHALRNHRPAAGVGVPGGLAYAMSAPTLSEPVLEAALLQAARHQFKLEDDSFYLQPTPDGLGVLRRVPEQLQRETQREIRARYNDQVQQTAHDIFRGRITPKQMLQASFRFNGHYHELDLSGEHGIRAMLARWDDMERASIRAEGASNLSISNILANVLNKFALQGYLFVEQAWRRIAQIVPVNDFKPLKSVNLLGDVMFKQLGATGELENASLGDQAFSNQANPFGRILTIPWTSIVNDDLGMLTGAPMKMGQGAGLALNDNFWALWAAAVAGTINGDDGNPFWRTTSSTTAGKAYNPNKMTGGTSVLASAGLKKAKALFDNQIDSNGNPLGFDGMMPILLFGPTNWQPAVELMKYVQLVYGGASAAMQPQGNVWAGTMEPVMSRYVESAKYVNSATAWWVLFNPIALPVIQVAFLNGVDTPAVLQAGPDYQFDRLGISIRGTMPFGSNMQNFRGGVYSAGA
jgi:hypothetical protein